MSTTPTAQPESASSPASGEIDPGEHGRLWETYPWRSAWKYPLAPVRPPDETGSRRGETERGKTERGKTEKEKTACAS